MRILLHVALIMPELPDIMTYVKCIERCTLGRTIEAVHIVSPFLVRSVDPEVESVTGRAVESVHRLGKRIILGLSDDLNVVIHLMVAGRFRWLSRQKVPRGRVFLGWFDFDNGRLALTEAGTRKRAALNVVHGPQAVAAFDRGGLDVLSCSPEEFAARLRGKNHTVKRALSAPHICSGIGNAYSDEILHAARLSPLTWTSRLSDGEIDRLLEATRHVLSTWTERLCKQFATRFPGPGDITAFRDGFAAHGRFGESCPVCATTIQRIRYADRETNYCPRCQTNGKILADRSMSRLLKDDWPATVDEAES